MTMRGRPKNATLSDVAKAAKVSASTVSRVLRNPEVVSAEFQSRVRHAVDKLGYVPDPAARSLASARSENIGVVIPSVTNNVFVDVLSGIYTVTQETKFSIEIGNTRYSPMQEEKILRMLLSQRPAGLIVTGLDQSAPCRALLESANCPIVQIMEFGKSPVDMLIGFSHRDAARAATRHLIERGYQRIAFLGAGMDPRAQRRLEGFTEAVEAESLFDERLVVTTPRPTSVTVGCELMAELLARAPDADAVFCINDDLALGALFECQRRRIAVPTQFGICGFNDLEMMAVANPPLTSVQTFRREMGRRAAEMLMARIGGASAPAPVVDLGFDLIERQSTRRPG